MAKAYEEKNVESSKCGHTIFQFLGFSQQFRLPFIRSVEHNGKKNINLVPQDILLQRLSF